MTRFLHDVQRNSILPIHLLRIRLVPHLHLVKLLGSSFALQKTITKAAPLGGRGLVSYLAVLAVMAGNRNVSLFLLTALMPL